MAIIVKIIEKSLIFLSYLRKTIILCTNNLLFIYCISCQKSFFFGRKVFGWQKKKDGSDESDPYLRDCFPCFRMGQACFAPMTEGWIPACAGMTEGK